MRVLNFGSLNLDHVYHVSHFPQPGETLSAAGYGVHLGGKGFNQSVAMARAGLSVCHAGCIGGDGLALREFLVDNGVDVSLLQTVAAPTGHAVIEVDQQGQNRILLYGGANLQVDAAYIDSVLSQFSPGDVLVLQNEISCLSTLVEKAVQRGLRIVLNPSPIGPQLTPQLIAQAEYLILNELEGGALSGQSQPLSCLRALLARCPHSKIVLTLERQALFTRTKAVFSTSAPWPRRPWIPRRREIPLRAFFWGACFPVSRWKRPCASRRRPPQLPYPAQAPPSPSRFWGRYPRFFKPHSSFCLIFLCIFS